MIEFRIWQASAYLEACYFSFLEPFKWLVQSLPKADAISLLRLKMGLNEVVQRGIIQYSAV
jgi:hypothetical protein